MRQKNQQMQSTEYVRRMKINTNQAVLVILGLLMTGIGIWFIFTGIQVEVIGDSFKTNFHFKKLGLGAVFQIIGMLTFVIGNAYGSVKREYLRR